MEKVLESWSNALLTGECLTTAGRTCPRVRMEKLESLRSRVFIIPMVWVSGSLGLAQHFILYSVFSARTGRLLFCQQFCYAKISFRFIKILYCVKPLKSLLIYLIFSVSNYLTSLVPI